MRLLSKTAGVCLIGRLRRETSPRPAQTAQSKEAVVLRGLAFARYASEGGAGDSKASQRTPVHEPVRGAS